MKRALNKESIKRLKDGIYQNILNYVLNDSDLLLEIRLSSTAVVYYKKSKILSLHSRKLQPTLLSKDYYRNKPEPKFDNNNPKSYFDYAKQLVNEHSMKKNNIEFTIQQKIAIDNRKFVNELVVVDMEYQFPQLKIENRTKNKSCFDLVAYKHQKNEIVLLELKQGYASSRGDSGVVDHNYKFLEHINHPDFKKTLISDVKSIITQKIELGIIDCKLKSCITEIDNATIGYKLVFAYKEKHEKKTYFNKYSKLNDILFVDLSNTEYILKQ